MISIVAILGYVTLAIAVVLAIVFGHRQLGRLATDWRPEHEGTLVSAEMLTYKDPSALGWHTVEPAHTVLWTELTFEDGRVFSAENLIASHLIGLRIRFERNGLGQSRLIQIV